MRQRVVVPSGVVKDHETVALEPGRAGRAGDGRGGGRVAVEGEACSWSAGPTLPCGIGGAHGERVDAVGARW